MSILNILFREDNKIGEIELHTIINEGATSKVTATKNPVAKGADSTDHIRVEPMTFNCIGVVSDTPVQLGGTIANIFKSGGRRISSETWNKLLILQAKREPFTLQQNLRSYDNIFISELTYSQDKDTSNVLIFNCKLEEINFVGQDEVNSENMSEADTKDRMTPLGNLGRKVFG